MGPMSDSQPATPQEIADSEALEKARARRLELGAAADQVEDLVARPAADPEWAARVAASLVDLQESFNDHVREVEGPGGLLAEVVDEAPRLVNGVKRMYEEHKELEVSIATTYGLVQGCAPDCEESVVEDVRHSVMDLLRLISRHRQAGADLVYQAYEVDIGFCD